MTDRYLFKAKEINIIYLLSGNYKKKKKQEAVKDTEYGPWIVRKKKPKQRR